MSKNKKLIHNIDVFYKLSLFNDRSSFLKYISAQAKPLNDAIKTEIESLIKDLGALKPDTSRPAQGKLMDVLANPSPDLNEVYKAVIEASNALPGNNTVAVQKALSLAGKIREMISQPSEPQSESVMVMPTDKITGYKPISKDVQKQLSELNVMLGFGLPIAIDGKLGPETMNAFKAFRNGMKLDPKTPLNELVTKVKSEYAQKNPTYHNFDSQVAEQKKNMERESTPPGIGVNAPKT